MKEFKILAATFEGTGVPIEKIKLARISVQHPQSLRDQFKPVLVKTILAPINPSDLFQIHGFYPSFPQKHQGFPFIAGNEGVFQVVESADTRFKRGQYVLPNILSFGTWRSAAYVSGNNLMALPTRPANVTLPLKDELVACSMLSVNMCTAYRLLKDFGDLKSGDTIIQNGANSGVGRAVIQLCKIWNIDNIAVIRSRKDPQDTNLLKEELLKIGATRVLTEEELEEVKDIKNVRAAFNCVAGKSAQNQFKVLGNDAYHVTYGGMSSEPFNAPVGALIFKNIKIVGFWVSQWKEQAQKDAQLHKQFDQMIEELIQFLREGKLDNPPVKIIDMKATDPGFDVSDEVLSNLQHRLIEAINLSQEAHSKGKVLLQFGEI